MDVAAGALVSEDSAQYPSESFPDFSDVDQCKLELHGFGLPIS